MKVTDLVFRRASSLGYAASVRGFRDAVGGDLGNSGRGREGGQCSWKEQGSAGAGQCKQMF